MHEDASATLASACREPHLAIEPPARRWVLILVRDGRLDERPRHPDKRHDERRTGDRERSLKEIGQIDHVGHSNDSTGSGADVRCPDEWSVGSTPNRRSIGSDRRIRPDPDDHPLSGAQ